MKSYNEFDNKEKTHNSNNFACRSFQTVINILFFVPKLILRAFFWIFSLIINPEKYAILFHELNAHGFYTLFAVTTAILCVRSTEMLAGIFNLSVSWPSIFHSFHYAHTFFASSTATLVSMKFSKNIFKSIMVGFFVPPVFCTISDIFMPYLGGKLLNISMQFHLCIFHNIGILLGFMTFGVLTGLFLHWWAKKNLWIVGISSHFLHDFVSTIASLAYLIGFGYSGWWSDLIIIALLMIVAVAIPCMISDLVLPILISVEDSVWKKNETCCK